MNSGEQLGRLGVESGEALRDSPLAKTPRLMAGQGVGGRKRLAPTPRQAPPVLFITLVSMKT